MALVTSAPGLPPRHPSYRDEEDMSTIPDPRSRAMSPALDPASSPPTMHHHPDLNDEVATLSTKLINAINYQTNLDDTLSATRCELDSSRERMKQLEAKVKSYEDQISRGILIEKAVADAEKAKLTANWEEERRRRIDAEKEKKSIELELENLTTALFEEANKMVTSARENARNELDLANRRSEQLKTQVADTEILLKSHQEQLTQLKTVLEQMSDDRTNSTAPPTPGLSKVDSKEHFGVDSLENLAMNEDLPPSYPTSFTHLIHPVLRTDLSSYDDFIGLVRLAKASSAPGSRISSGSYGSLGLGLGLYTKNQTNTQAPSSSSTPSVSNGNSPVTPNTPLSATSASSIPISISTPLSDTKFYKRALSEDIEPCLRLDTAPGISWMARRSMLKSMCEGSLVVEPMPASTKKFSLTFSCALCGENRSGDEFSRGHRFRISESSNAQRYPLCRYCLGRIRSCCDFIGFLRMLKDGHWRAEDEEAEKAAWEESVRLREQMFWCRMGGGVLPGPIPHNKDEKPSPRMSEDVRRSQEDKISEEFQKTGEIKPKDVTPITTSVATLEADAERPPTSTEADSPTTSIEPEKLSVSIEVGKPSTETSISPVSLVSKRPSVIESETALSPEAKQLSTEIKRSSTPSNDKVSKVSNIRMMFEKKKKDNADGLWQAAQDDAAAPPATSTKSESASPSRTSENLIKESPSQPTLALKSSSPGDSSDERPLSITIPGSFS